MKKYENPSLEVNSFGILEDVSDINVSKMDDTVIPDKEDGNSANAGEIVK